MAQRSTNTKPSQKKTHSQQAGDWFCWKQFLSKVCVKNDPFFQIKDPEDSFAQSDYIESFMYMYRFNYFGTTIGGTISHDRISQSISNIASKFTAEGFINPTHDRNGNRKVSITKQLKPYRDKDPVPTRQSPLPATVFEYPFKDKASSLHLAIGELTSGALFYTMQSCEYSSTEGKPKTKLLTLGDIRFYKNRKLQKIDCQNADDTKITF